MIYRHDEVPRIDACYLTATMTVHDMVWLLFCDSAPLVVLHDVSA